jgi:hypothetical protein
MVERLSHKEEVEGSIPPITTMPKLTELFKIIDTPLSFGDPIYSLEDQNGIIHLCNKEGKSRIMMSKKTYKDLLEYKSETSIGTGCDETLT